MWQQQGEQDRHSNSQQGAYLVVSSSSKSSSSSSSSSPSPFTSTSTVPRISSKTMEEVWKDITLSTAAPILDHNPRRPYYHHHHPSSAATCNGSSIAGAAELSHLRGMILQDFLGRPSKGPPAAVVQPAHTVGVEEPGGRHGDMVLPGSRRLNQPPPPPLRSSPATVLSLNSGVELQYVDGVAPGSRPAGFPSGQNHSGQHSQHHGSTGHWQPSSSSSITAAAFSDSLGSPCQAIFSSFSGNKKRVPEQQPVESSDGPGGERRHKRMIKNRESAARSRARKQAYTNELELEVNHLTEENERLRRQQEELRAKLAAQLSTKKVLQRSSTAPF